MVQGKQVMFPGANAEIFKQVFDAQQREPTCEMEGGENFCDNLKHYRCTDQGEGYDIALRVCPRYIAEERERAAQQQHEYRSRLADPVIHLCKRVGLTKFERGTPFWSQLIVKLDPGRAVSAQFGDKSLTLAQFLDRVAAACANFRADGPNVLLTGNCGTGKSTLQALFFLAALDAGLNAEFFDSIMLRSLAARLNSNYTETHYDAEQELSDLISADVLVWSDAGDTRGSRRELPETLAAILERTGARLFVSSNLPMQELDEHPDIGRRALSRMLASRGEVPAIRIALQGSDQRWHGAGGGDLV